MDEHGQNKYSAVTLERILKIVYRHYNDAVMLMDENVPGLNKEHQGRVIALRYLLNELEGREADASPH